MGRYILMAIATVLALIFLMKMKKASKYEQMFAGLDGIEYPFCNLFTAGMGWAMGNLFALKKTNKKTGVTTVTKAYTTLTKSAVLLYDKRYVDYYVTVVWAQTLTYVHLFATFTVLLAAILYGSKGFILAAGAFITLVMSVYAYTAMSNNVTSRKEACDRDFPEMVSTMAVLLNAGMQMHDVWVLVCAKGKGVIYDLMREALNDMKGGMSDKEAYYKFGQACNSDEIRKFIRAMIQSMEVSGEELLFFMERQSKELWDTKRQRMLQSGEKASSKLLGPIMLIFIGVMIVVMVAAFGGAIS